MKNITIAFFILATITSCNDDILEYSCNPDVNKFVKTNILILSQIKLDEFNQMSNLLQRATFRSYSPEKRFELWTEKLEKMLAIEPLTELEAIHIEKLINHLSIESFISNEEGDPLRIQNEIFSINWQDYALNSLKWDKARLAFVISSLFISEADYKYSLNQAKIEPKQLTVPVYDCGCNTGTNFCDSYTNGNCVEGNCNSSASGCGWVWMEECNGQCY